MVRGRGRRTEQVQSAAPPRDVEALEQVLMSLEDGVDSREDAHTRVVTALADTLGLGYVGLWVVAGDGFALGAEQGPLVDGMRGAAGGRRALPAGAGMLGEAAASRRPVLASGESPDVSRCERWKHAQRLGAVEAAAVPLVQGGAVVAVLECFSDSSLPAFRSGKWETISRVIGIAQRQALVSLELRETYHDRVAVTTVVNQVGEAPDEDTALRTALESVRTAFGWAYGSFWRLDEQARVLRFDCESGSAGEQFRQVTLSASFAEGVGLSGRAWRARDLVFVHDLAEMTDCVRAPAAQRAGVRSGVCFPIVDGDRVIGTMDFFTTDRLELSTSRTAALRDVQQLLSQRLAGLRRTASDAHNARLLLDTVARLRDAAADAGRVADEAVDRTVTMTAEVAALGQASAAINDVIKLISGIAGQTNLLALNATIEAARAGDVGKGFAVVAQEVKDLARETATATSRVADQIAGLHASSEAVSAGISRTSDIIEQLGPVQTRINRVLEEQADLAMAFEGARWP